MFKSGFVTIVGRPNVGKSTLLNEIMGEKLSIVSNKPQTTRNNIQTILTGDDYQLVFVDTPGIHKPKHKLGEYMVNSAKDSIKEVDLVLFLVNPCEEIGRGDKFILEALKAQKAPVFLVVNKVDENSHDKVAKTLEMFSKEYNFDFEKSYKVYDKILKMLAIAPSREYYEKEIMRDYSKQAELAIRYAKLIFGKNFPPY